MSQHLAGKILEGYLNRTLNRDQLLAADRHLAECAGCHEQISDLADMDPLTITIAEVFAGDPEYDEHLGYEQLEGYVDGSLSDVSREIADVHIADCGPCREQLNDLRKLKASIGHSPVGYPASAMGQASFWQWFTSTFALRAALAAGALVVLGFSLWAVSIWMRPGRVENVAVEESPAHVSENSVVVGANGVEIAAANNTVVEETKPIVSLLDGDKRIEVDKDGNLSGIDAGRLQNRLKALLTTQDLRVSPAAKELRTASGVLMGGGSPGAPFALSSPVGKVIASDRPQFSWHPLADADSYTVTVFDESFSKVAESGSLKQVSWTPDTRLKRGAVYIWQVSATKAGQEIKSPVRPAPDARFKIIDAATANDIEAARRSGSRLLLGSLYANSGMTAEAEREFQTLLKQNPRSELLKKLLRKVQSAK
jgi:hypothetical protein